MVEEDHREFWPIREIYWPTIIFGAIFYLLGICFLITNIMNCDVAQFLYISKRLLAGDRLYLDIIEMNLPLVHYLGIPAVWLGSFYHGSEIAIFYTYIILIISLPIILCWQLIPQAFPDASNITRQMFFLGLIFSLMAYFIGNFGQREHLMLALTMPYLLLAIIRALGTAINVRFCLLIGILAGVGVAFKPHFLILPVSIELYLNFMKGKPIHWWRPENLGMITVLGLYAVYCALYHHEYFKIAPVIFQTYYDYCNTTLLYLLSSKEAISWLIVTLIILFIKLPAGDRVAARVLYVASTAFLFIGIIQRKGWPYHFYPAGLTLLLLIIFIFFRWAELHSKLTAKIKGGINGLAILFLCGLTLLGGFKVINNYLTYLKTEIPSLISLARTYAKGQPIYMFSTSVKPFFPLVNHSGTLWQTHYPSLWPLERIFPEQADSEEIEAARALYTAPMNDLERSVVETTIADLRAMPPVLLIFDERLSRWSSGMKSGEFEEFFSQARGFSKLMDHYAPLAQMGPYKVYISHEPLS